MLLAVMVTHICIQILQLLRVSEDDPLLHYHVETCAGLQGTRTVLSHLDKP